MILGARAPGKTSIISSLVHGTCGDKVETTVGCNFVERNLQLEDRSFCFRLVDTPGDKRFWSLLRPHLLECAAALVVYDATDRESFDAVPEVIQMIRDITGVSITLAANKTDLADRREVSSNEGVSFAAGWNTGFFEVSAKTGSNVDAMLCAIALELSVPSKLSVQVTGHEEDEGSTWYQLQCSSTPSGCEQVNWCTRMRLCKVRECIHHPVKEALADLYPQYFADTPFARRGGLPGSTARLQAWFASVGKCIEEEALPERIFTELVQILAAPPSRPALLGQSNGGGGYPLDKASAPNHGFSSSRGYPEDVPVDADLESVA